MTIPPTATFPSLDEAEGALDWIGIAFGEDEGRFHGELTGDDRDLLEAAIAADDTPGPVRDLARALLNRWDADGGDTLVFAVGY